MEDKEQREILEAIARDPEKYPRDRISAIKTLREIDKPAATSLEAELEGLVGGE